LAADNPKEAVPIVLDFVQPATALRRHGAGRDYLQADIPRHRSGDRSTG